MEHVLYETGDKDAPNSIRDGNGEVVLGLCRICGRAEVELNEPCACQRLADEKEKLRAEIDRLRKMVEWQPIHFAPVNQQILLADMSGGNRFMYIGVIYPSTGHGRATHWLPMLPLPNA